VSAGAGEEEDDDDDDEPVEIDVGDSLDLHTFAPRDVADLVAEYVQVCAAERDYAEVRIIHGKGKGTLRRIVHSVLEKHPAVASFRQADANWGATIVVIRR
jgi:dsDNA-specific endonuclease/ATPase MutS2